VAGWTLEQRPDGLWTLVSPVGRHMLDIAFRHDVGDAMRHKIMGKILEGLELPEDRDLHT
jgi:hypothetical protein